MSQTVIRRTCPIGKCGWYYDEHLTLGYEGLEELADISYDYSVTDSWEDVVMGITAKAAEVRAARTEEILMNHMVSHGLFTKRQAMQYVLALCDVCGEQKHGHGLKRNPLHTHRKKSS